MSENKKTYGPERYRGSDLSEAKRRLGQAKTLFERMKARHRTEEEAYEAKIEILQEGVNALEAQYNN